MPKVLKKEMKKDACPTQGFFQFDEILASQILDNELYFLVKWKGFAKSEATWETRDKFPEDCSQLLNFQINQIESTINQTKLPPKTKKITPVQLRRSPRKGRSKQQKRQFEQNLNLLANWAAKNRKYFRNGFPLQDNKSSVEKPERPKKNIFEEQRTIQEINVWGTMKIESIRIPEKKECVVIGRSNAPTAKEYKPSKALTQKRVKNEEKSKNWQQKLNVIAKQQHKIGGSIFYKLIYLEQNTPKLSTFLIEKNASEQFWPHLKSQSHSNNQNQASSNSNMQFKQGKSADNAICLDEQ